MPERNTANRSYSNTYKNTENTEKIRRKTQEYTKTGITLTIDTSYDMVKIKK